MPDNEVCYYYISNCPKELEIFKEVFRHLNPDMDLKQGLYSFRWLKNTKCVWVTPEVSLITRLIKKQYPNQHQCTFSDVKTVAMSLLLGIDDYY